MNILGSKSGGSVIAFLPGAVKLWLLPDCDRNLLKILNMRVQKAGSMGTIQNTKEVVVYRSVFSEDAR